ncbi:MAG TPA: hypothetical protein VNE59_15535 [Burkholderiales bacterium]|nr:hypothetical protein [Burkholderiales bacterium]
MRKRIGLICCAAAAVLLSQAAAAGGLRAGAQPREAGPGLASRAAENSDGRFAQDRDAGRERAGERTRKPGGARPKSGAAVARSRVYWRSDRGRVKSRAELAPE